MSLQESIAKFTKIVKANPDKLTDRAITETARSIVIADVGHIGDAGRGKYEHLTLSALADSGVQEFNGVCYGCSHQHGEVSDVMCLRIMCDVLTLLLDGDKPFAMRYSADVAKAMKRRERTKTMDYLDADDCEKILDSYMSNVSDYDEELKPIFERTSYYLSELKKLQSSVDKECYVITRDCVSEIWLPKDFQSYGFNVKTRIPNVIAALNGSKVSHMWFYNLGFVMDVLSKLLVGVDTSDTARFAFMRRLREFGAVCGTKAPIGVGIESNVRTHVYMPSHFLTNQALKVIYEKYFTKKKPLTDEGVSVTLDSMKSLYKVR